MEKNFNKNWRKKKISTDAEHPFDHAIDIDAATQIYQKSIQKMQKSIKNHEFEAIFPKAHIEAYVQVCYKRICDEIPHAIMGGFKDNMRDNIEEILQNIILEEEEDLIKLLEEKEGIMAQRKKLETTLENLKKCMSVLKQNTLNF